jgi:hypothetical protein
MIHFMLAISADIKMPSVYGSIEMRDDFGDRTAPEWAESAADIIRERGLDYGDPRINFLRIFKISRLLGVQLRNPSELAVIFLATKLSRIVEAPAREDSYLDAIGFASILANLRFATPDDWSDIEFDAKLE